MDKITITKDNILQYTTQEEIFKSFLNVNELPKSNISSPLTTDKNPSFKVYSNGSFKCNSSGKQGDAFQFVADLNSLDCKTQFNEVLNIIAKEMNIPLQNTNSINDTPKDLLSTNNTSVAKSLKGIAKEIGTNVATTIEPFATEKQPKTTNVATAIKPFATQKQPKTTTVGIHKINVTIIEMTKTHLQFWKNLGVDKEILEKYKVSAISNYSFFSQAKNKTFNFNIKNEIIAFCYEVNGNYEVYIPAQPLQNQEKVFNNGLQNGDIFGLEQLGTEKTENLIICAGKKDTILANSKGFKAVTFRSETHNPTKEQIETLQNKGNTLFICYDNDKGGETGRNAIVKKFTNVTPLQLPTNEKIKGYDVTDYFQEHTAQDFQKIIDLAVKNKNVVEVSENTDLTIFHKAENYLSKNYDLRFDVIANEIEISKKDENTWKELNESTLYVEMKKKHINIAIGDLKAILTSDFVPQINPLKDYFESLPIWDKKTDYINDFLSYVKLADGEDKEQFVYNFKKWCVRSVKCAINKGYYNKQAFILSDNAKGQNIGKTTYLRYLTPKSLEKYYCENLPDDKDAIKRLGQNFIINLDELATMGKGDINKLKSMFSSDKIKTRLPYGKKDVIISRVANFIGSSNETAFLVDETGSVRWICFVVDKIDFKYSLEFDIDNLWSQAYTLANDKSFNETMTVEDVKQNEMRNDKFQVLSPERELIPKFLKIPTENDKSDHLSSTEIVNYISAWQIGIKLIPNNVGKAMPKCGFVRQKHKGLWGYWVVKINP